MVRAHGLLRVTHGPGPLARGLARVLRLPPEGDAVDTHLLITPSADGDVWRRTFGGRELVTRQYAHGVNETIERFGHLEFRFLRETSREGVVFRQLATALVAGPLRVHLPRACAPRIDAREDSIGLRRRYVDVRIALPAIGTLLTYEGTIDVEEAAS